METPDLDEYPTDRARCAHLVLKKLGGHPGAEELWQVLRDHSISKLTKLNAQMPNDHKSILRIYARDCLTKEHPNPQTKCFKEEWAQEIQKIPKSHLQKCISLFRYSIGLTNRASEINQERASIIISNNPIPDLNDWEGHSSPIRFLSRGPSTQQPKGYQGKQYNLPPLKSSKAPQNKISTPKATKPTQIQFAGENCRFLTAKDTKRGHGVSKRFKRKKLLNPCYIQSPKATTNQKLLKTNEKPMGCSYTNNIPISLKDDMDPCSGPFIHNW